MGLISNAIISMDQFWTKAQILAIECDAIMLQYSPVFIAAMTRNINVASTRVINTGLLDFINDIQ